MSSATSSSNIDVNVVEGVSVSDDVNSSYAIRKQGVSFAEDDEIIECSDASNNNIHQSVESKNNDDVPPPIRKQRVGSDGTEAGAVAVDEIAPDVNRRFYLGLTRPSVIVRNRQERRRRREQRMQGEVNGEEGTTAVDDEENLGLARRISSVFTNQYTQNDTLVEATLVEESQEVYTAQQVGYCESRWKMFAFIMAFTLVVFAVLLSVFIADDVEEILKIPATDFPSVTPQTSFDTRPTFDIVQERGYLLCGLQNRTEDSFHVDLVSFTSRNSSSASTSYHSDALLLF